MVRSLTRFSIAAAALAVSLVSSVSAQTAGKTVEFSSGSEKASGYLALPEGTGSHAAIVVVPEWWGLNDFIKSKADEFARAGYVALAVDLYRGKVAKDPETAHELMRGLPEDRAIRDLKGAVVFLRSRPEVGARRMASIGWCMGGGYALRLALAEPRLSGTVINYGSLVTDDAAIASLQVPLLGNFGGQDQGILPASVQEFERKAKAAGKIVDFKVYPDAGHAFASAPDQKSYRPDDAKDANARTAAFLAKVLGKS